MSPTEPSPRFVVLGAVDDGPLAREVVRVGANFARTVPGGELHLIHVLENLPPPVSIVPAPVGMGLTTGEIVAEARKRLDELSAERELGSAHASWATWQPGGHGERSFGWPSIFRPTSCSLARTDAPASSG
jgi:nucleotide-binding universal stress UspA family protein